MFAPLCQARLSSQQKVVDFQELAGLFSKRYAFIEWKRQAIQFDGLDLQPWIDRIDQSQTDLDFFEICAQYRAKYQDGYTGFELPSTYEAILGFSTDIYDGKESAMTSHINSKK